MTCYTIETGVYLFMYSSNKSFSIRLIFVMQFLYFTFGRVAVGDKYLSTMQTLREI